MRKLITLVFALGLLLGVAGSALADCGANHGATSTTPPERPPVQM